MRFWHIIGTDLYRYGDGLSIRAFFKHYFVTPGFKYTFWMRSANYLAKRKHIIGRLVYYLCRVILHKYSLKYGILIPYNTCIGPGLYIGHYGGIVINDKVIIGSNCNINHGVTIGIKYGGENPGVPIIGDRVYFGPGSKVIGGILLGDDVAVGANAVVVKSAPKSSVVVGVPAHIISSNGASEYVVNTNYE